MNASPCSHSDDFIRCWRRKSQGWWASLLFFASWQSACRLFLDSICTWLQRTLPPTSTTRGGEHKCKAFHRRVAHRPCSQPHRPLSSQSLIVLTRLAIGVGANGQRSPQHLRQRSVDRQPTGGHFSESYPVRLMLTLIRAAWRGSMLLLRSIHGAPTRPGRMPLD